MIDGRPFELRPTRYAANYRFNSVGKFLNVIGQIVRARSDDSTLQFIENHQRPFSLSFLLSSFLFSIG